MHCQGIGRLVCKFLVEYRLFIYKYEYNLRVICKDI